MWQFTRGYHLQPTAQSPYLSPWPRGVRRGPFFRIALWTLWCCGNQCSHQGRGRNQPKTRLKGWPLSQRFGLADPNWAMLGYIMSGWWIQPLWKIWKSVGTIIPNMKNKIHVPNHQPDVISPTKLANWMSSILPLNIVRLEAKAARKSHGISPGFATTRKPIHLHISSSPCLAYHL